MFNNSSICSPPVKYNSFTCGGGIFGSAKNNIEKEESVQEETNTSAATQPKDTSKSWIDAGTGYDIDWEGSGTEADPYLISTAQEFAGLAWRIYNDSVKYDSEKSTSGANKLYYNGVYFKQTANFDVSAYWWVPIGNSLAGNSYFSGVYDGNRRSISGVFTQAGTATTNNYQGLFGALRGAVAKRAVIKELCVIDSNIQGNSYIGGIAGYCYMYCDIQNCYNKASVSGTSYVGGIVGSLYTSTVSHCYNLGSVRGGSSRAYTGGIVGSISGAILSISNCFNVGSVTSGETSYTHAVAGSYTTSKNISNCYYGGDCTIVDVYATKDENIVTNAKTLSWYTNTTIWSEVWDFFIWNMTSENDLYPILMSQFQHVTLIYSPNGGIPNSTIEQVVVFDEPITTLPADTYTYTGYEFVGWKVDFSNEILKPNTKYNYYDALKDALISVRMNAVWEINSYILDVNGNLDGEAVGNLGNYAKFDLYINGSRVATQINDYCSSIAYGSTYEVKNITYATDKAYVGVYSDVECTIASSLSGKIPANRRNIYIKIRTMTWNDYAATSFDSGSGTSTDPFIIKTPEQLAKVAVDSRSSTLSGKYYKMVADVDLSAHIWEGIGDTSQKFAGCFDGDLYQIKNIITTIDNYQVSNVIGLFSFVQSPSVIKNIIMKGGTVTAGASSSNCGIIAGATESAALITNCIVDGITVQGNDVNSSMGGIAGKFTSGTISNCIVMNCTINSNGTVGGICGWRGTLTDCAVINTVLASGWNISSREVSIGWSDNSTVNSSYAKVTITGVEKKIMYGDSTAWTNWTYNANLNNGYPVQTTLFHIGGLSGSTNVYNYLKNTLGFIAT